MFKFLQKNSDFLFRGALLPTVQMVLSRTLGLDLVSVQPMSLPRRNLQHVEISFKIIKKEFKFLKGYNHEIQRF